MRITRVLVVLAAVAAIALPDAMAFGFDDSVNPPGGIVGTPYSFQFKGRNGCPPYSFTISSGAPPPGLSMDSGGTISGTPTTAGSFTFWVEIHDSAVSCPPNGSVPSQRPFTIDITAKLAVTTNIGGPATTGVLYSLQFVADGGGDQVWSIYSGTLPEGITFSPTGLVSGTPAVAGTYDFVVRVTDGTRTDTHAVELVVVDPLSATASAPAAGEVGVPLETDAPTVKGGKEPYTWALAAGSALPADFALDSATGVITGTPSTAGTTPVKVSVTDKFGTVATVDVPLVVRAKVAVKTTKLSVIKVGKLYKATLHTLGGVGPFTWKVTEGKFLVGIRLDRKTGVMSGKPSKAGTFPLTFTVTDALGQTSEASLTLTVNPGPKKKKK